MNSRPAIGLGLKARCASWHVAGIRWRGLDQMGLTLCGTSGPQTYMYMSSVSGIIAVIRGLITVVVIEASLVDLW
jgi:hypothetical protein